jgi:parallel beta-helix repeat protein
VEISARLFGINLDGATNLTLYGLDAVQASGPDLYDGTGIGATSNHVSITKRDCIIEECRAERNTGGGIISGDAEGFVVQNNTVRQVQAGRGLYVFGTGNRVLRNHIATTGGTGLTASLSIDSIFAFNRVEDVRGAHGNGMSCYQGCHNLLVFGNVIRTQKGIGLTHQSSGNLWFVMNDIQCPPDEVWGNRALENNANVAPATGSGPFVINVLNNTCGPALGMDVPGGASAVVVGKTGNATHNTVNNATFGNTSWEFAGSRGAGSVKGAEIGNVLCGLLTSNGQSVTNPYFLSGDNLYQPDPSAMFADWQAGDYRPLAGGVLDGAGQDASPLLPSGAWLDGFDMARDCDGRSFDWSVNPPVGAYLP